MRTDKIPFSSRGSYAFGGLGSFHGLHDSVLLARDLNEQAQPGNSIYVISISIRGSAMFFEKA